MESIIELQSCRPTHTWDLATIIPKYFERMETTNFALSEPFAYENYFDANMNIYSHINIFIRHRKANECWCVVRIKSFNAEIPFVKNYKFVISLIFKYNRELIHYKLIFS